MNPLLLLGAAAVAAAFLLGKKKEEQSALPPGSDGPDRPIPPLPDILPDASVGPDASEGVDFTTAWESYPYDAEFYPASADKTTIPPPATWDGFSTNRDCSVIAVGMGWWERVGMFAQWIIDQGVTDPKRIQVEILKQYEPFCSSSTAEAAIALREEILERLEAELGPGPGLPPPDMGLGGLKLPTSPPVGNRRRRNIVPQPGRRMAYRIGATPSGYVGEAPVSVAYQQVKNGWRRAKRVPVAEVANQRIWVDAPLILEKPPPEPEPNGGRRRNPSAGGWSPTPGEECLIYVANATGSPKPYVTIPWSGKPPKAVSVVECNASGSHCRVKIQGSSDEESWWVQRCPAHDVHSRKSRVSHRKGTLLAGRGRRMVRR